MISVVIATHGDARWKQLGRSHAASSLVEQAKHDEVIRHYTHETLARARNISAKYAKGDWLCFLDADDKLHRGYIDEMDKAIALCGEEALYVPAMQFEANGDVSTPSIPAWDSLIYDINCACIGTVVPREAFLDAGGFAEWPIYEDWELWLRLIKRGMCLVPVQNAIYRATISKGSRNGGLSAEAQRTYREVRELYADVPTSTWRAAKV